MGRGRGRAGRRSYTKQFNELAAAGFPPGYIDQSVGKIPINTDDWWLEEEADGYVMK